MLAALCYSEFAASVPVAGSAYTYAYATLGEFVAWVIGWDLILEYALGAATVAVGWSGILITLLGQLGLTFPAAFSAAPGHGRAGRRRRSGHGGLESPGDPRHRGRHRPAGLRRQRVRLREQRHRGDQGRGPLDRDRRGRRCSSIRRTGIPFIPPNTGTFGEYGWSGILRGAGVIFFAYIGFDAVSTSAQEARNPQRDMPRGILGSLAICTVLFVLVSGVMVGLVPYKTMLNQPAPLVLDDPGRRRAGRRHAVGDDDGRRQRARDGRRARRAELGDGRDDAGAAADLPRDVAGRAAARVGGTRPPALPHAARLDDRHRASSSRLPPGFTPIGTLGALVSIGTLMAFVIVSIGIIVLRRTRPDLPRPFRMPWVPALPLLSAAVSLVLMLGLPWATWERLIIWMAIGIAVYFAYGYRRSRLRPE